MRVYSSPTRIAELTRWVKKNKNSSWREFVLETGGRQTQFYHIRSNLGLSQKKPQQSIAMREAAKRRAEQEEAAYLAEEAARLAESLEQVLTAPPDVPEIQQEMCQKTLVEIQEDNEQFLAGKEEPAPKKEEVVVEGNTPDFIWYEMDLLQKRLQSVSAGLNYVMVICQSRDREQKKMMHHLIHENTTLRVENNSLRQQVMELTEMINGTSI
jgi:hypothetical protein